MSVPENLNPYASPTGPIDSFAVPAGPLTSPADMPFWAVVAQASKKGGRLCAKIFGVICSLAVVPGLMLTAFGFGSGRGLPFYAAMPLPPVIYRPVLAFFAMVINGLIIGAFVGFTWGMIRRILPRSVVEGVYKPIRLTSANKHSPDGMQVPKRRRIVGFLVGIFWTLACLAASLIFASFFVGRYVGKSVDQRLADATAAADADDPNWRMDDFMEHRRQVPDDENSAYVVAEALLHIPTNWPAVPAYQPGSPPNAVTHPVADAQAKVSSWDQVVNRLTDEEAELLRDELNDYQEAVEIARTLVDFEHGSHDLIIARLPYETRLPETQDARTIARLLSADAGLRAHDGEIDKALDSCRACLNTGRSIGDEPFLISLLVRNAIGTVALNSVRTVLGQGEASDETLAKLQALINDELHEPLYLAAMRGERAGLVEIVRKLASGEISIGELSDSLVVKETNGLTQSGSINAPWGTLMFDSQHATALEWMNRAVNIAKNPPYERAILWQELDDGIRAETKTTLGAFRSLIPALFMAGTSASDTAQARYESHLGATLIVLAAERHRIKNGSWPATIEAIDPEILDQAPLDPNTGKPFLMTYQEGQFKVYSMGENRRDEQGAYAPKLYSKRIQDDIGSWLWDPKLRSEQETND